MLHLYQHAAAAAGERGCEGDPACNTHGSQEVAGRQVGTGGLLVGWPVLDFILDLKSSGEVRDAFPFFMCFRLNLF